MLSKSRPIAGATFILIHKQPKDSVAAGEALKFFAWAYTKGGKMAEELDYVPMPAAVVTAIQKSWQEVKDDKARVTVKGTAIGIDVGASVKLTLDTSCLVDLPTHRLVQVDWKQTDEREQGPVNPACTLSMSTIGVSCRQ